MTAPAAEQKISETEFSWLNFNRLPIQIVAVIAAALLISAVIDQLWTWPDSWIIPFKLWISDFFVWLDKKATFGAFTVKEFTRGLAWMLKQPLKGTEYLLWRGASPEKFLPTIWVFLAGLAGILVYRWHGARGAWLTISGLLVLVSIDAAPIILNDLAKGVRVPPWTEREAFIGFSQWPAYFLTSLIGKGTIKAVPWVAVVLGFGIAGHWAGGWRLAIFTVLCMSYLAFTGLWRESMKTFSLVVVAVPFSALIGVLLGVWITRSKRVAAIITPLFDLMQATPHLAYLVPVVVMFGAGQVPALIATVIFAMPPMARCTILAIQTVPDDITESGRMSGSTPRQLLWKVQLPSAQRTLLLGLNQVIMQTLAMVVICSLVGAQGLGHKLLFSLQQLKLGYATMQGIAIVLMAVVLDRITQAYAYRSSDYIHHDETTFVQRHKHVLLFCAVLVISIVAALYYRDVSVLSRKHLLISSKEALEFDKSIKLVTYFLIDYIRPIRDLLTVRLLIPMRDLYQAIPWSVIVAVLGLMSWRLGGVRMALLNLALMFVVILAVGNWSLSVTTFYYVSTALFVCVLIGLPLGILSARFEPVARVVMTFCDVLQTFPSFIYLLPAIMLFRVGDLAIIFAIVPYAMVPAIRYTYLGLKGIPAVTTEAAVANGCTYLQRLTKVELPVAVPEIMLGINQTIMMALAMTAITALIGGNDLGQEIYRALPTSDAGRGVMAGLGIASLGIIFDRLIHTFAAKRKKDLGLES